MANTKLTEQEAARQEAIQETVSKTEQFLNENKKTFYGVLIAALVIGLGVLAYTQFILKPQQRDAMEQMYKAEASFAAGEYALALEGDGNNLGFADIAKKYGNKAGAAVNFYAGICELQAGNWQAAIDYLKKYNGKDKILAARATANIGDAYVGLENYAEAVKCFEKAASMSDNMFSADYLLKAGVAYEEMGNDAQALACYNKIKESYPTSIEAYDIEKYISRIEAK